ncbi:MAG: hypothetical protein NT096_10555 [Proteobacteria bacterium]|nr:hypothetical protein [Pseudomonadota bacterium]
MKKGPARLKTVTVNLNFPPFLKLKGQWESDESEQMAAWEIYVELVTRIAVQELKPGEGLLREALNSLHTLFLELRQILRKYGPSIGRPKGNGDLSLGTIALAILVSSLRPILDKWHPLLLDYEVMKRPNVSAYKHEASWEHNEDLRKDLADLRNFLEQYSRLLEKAAGIPPLFYKAVQ